MGKTPAPPAIPLDPKPRIGTPATLTLIKKGKKMFPRNAADQVFLMDSHVLATAFPTVGAFKGLYNSLLDERMLDCHGAHSKKGIFHSHKLMLAGNARMDPLYEAAKESKPIRRLLDVYEALNAAATEVMKVKGLRVHLLLRCYTTGGTIDEHADSRGNQIRVVDGIVSKPSASHKLTFKVHHTDKAGSTMKSKDSVVDTAYEVKRLVLAPGAFTYAIGPIASGYSLCAGGPEEPEARRAVWHEHHVRGAHGGLACPAMHC